MSTPSKHKDLKLAANLNVLRRKDPVISHIVDSASHVVLYQYTDQDAWTKMNVEGAMFLFARHESPTYGLCILNRMSTTNYHVPLTHDLIVHVVGDYLMFRSTNSPTLGVWFFDSADRPRIADRVVDLCKGEPLASTDTAAVMAAATFTSGNSPSNSTAPTSSRSSICSKSTDNAHLLASAQSDLMGLVTRARGTSSGTTSSSFGRPDSSVGNGTVSDQDRLNSTGPNADMTRIMAKLSMGPTSSSISNSGTVSILAKPTMADTNTLQTAPTPSIDGGVSPATANGTTLNGPPPSTPTLNALPTTVDPFRLAGAILPMIPGSLPPGLPSREAVRDALIARVSGDPMFLDAIFQCYLMSFAMPPPPGVQSMVPHHPSSPMFSPLPMSGIPPISMAMGSSPSHLRPRHPSLGVASPIGGNPIGHGMAGGPGMPLMPPGSTQGYPQIPAFPR